MSTRPWLEVMVMLRGQRLAIYDDLIRGRRLTIGDVMRWTPEAQDPLCWLFYHHMAWIDSEGFFHARGLPEAKQLWTMTGACKEAARVFSGVPQPVVAPAPVSVVPPAPVTHTHQAEVFALEGFAP